jgi:cyclophilin family peptidyl-prolyl cis-trans isomerase
MILAHLASLALALPVAPADVTVRWEAPGILVTGGPFPVQVTLEAPAEGGSVPAWLLTPAAFSVDGNPLAERGSEAQVALPAGARLELSFDLAPHLDAEKPFELSFAQGEQGPVAVSSVYRAAPGGADFMSMAPEELDDYQVFLFTNRGEIRLEFLPDKAPNAVRNFLDLAGQGFYDGTTFHRVIPGFMIQGGDPAGTGTGSGPRKLQAEFNDTLHVRGVLSQARSQDPDSGSCQFFIVHGEHAKHLDNQYTAFGRAVSGLDVVDAIATTPRGPGDRPIDPQVIEKAIVIEAPAGEQG